MFTHQWSIQHQEEPNETMAGYCFKRSFMGKIYHCKKKKDVAVEHKRDGIYPQNPFFPHLQRLSNVSFLNSSISRWLLNTFCDLSTTTKKSRRTKSFFSPQDEACKKTLTVSSIILFSICISFYFQPLFSIFSNLPSITITLPTSRGGVNIHYFVSSVFDLYSLKPTM